LIHCHGFHVSDADRKGKRKGKGKGKGKGKRKGKGRPGWWIIIIATTTVNTAIDHIGVLNRHL
jgi:hypothetical protein